VRRSLLRSGTIVEINVVANMSRRSLHPDAKFEVQIVRWRPGAPSRALIFAPVGPTIPLRRGPRDFIAQIYKLDLFERFYLYLIAHRYDVLGF